MKYHLFKSQKHPHRAITIGERDNGTYFIPSAVEALTDEENTFESIEEIEKALKDVLELIIPKTQIN